MPVMLNLVDCNIVLAVPHNVSNIVFNQMTVFRWMMTTRKYVDTATTSRSIVQVLRSVVCSLHGQALQPATDETVLIPWTHI